MSKRQRNGFKTGTSSSKTAGKKRKDVHVAVVPGFTRTGGQFGRGAMSDEKKYFDTETYTFAAHLSYVPVAGAIVEPSLNLLKQGSTAQERLGNKCRLKNINSNVTLWIDPSVTASSAGDIVRVIWYIDHQCNGAAAAVTDILEAALLPSYRNMNKVERFTILKDKKIVLNASTVNATQHGQEFKTFKFAWKGDRVLHFNNTGASAVTIADVRSDNIGCMAISLQNFTNFSMNSRIKFTE